MVERVDFYSDYEYCQALQYEEQYWKEQYALEQYREEYAREEYEKEKKIKMSNAKKEIIKTANKLVELIEAYKDGSEEAYLFIANIKSAVTYEENTAEEDSSQKEVGPWRTQKAGIGK
jgi:hypothetical protein